MYSFTVRSYLLYMDGFKQQKGNTDQKCDHFSDSIIFIPMYGDLKTQFLCYLHTWLSFYSLQKSWVKKPFFLKSPGREGQKLEHHGDGAKLSSDTLYEHKSTRKCILMSYFFFLASFFAFSTRTRDNTVGYCLILTFAGCSSRLKSLISIANLAQPAVIKLSPESRVLAGRWSD